MAASRPGRAAGFGAAAAWGLLAAVLCAGCGVQREFVRRGQVLDSAATRVWRMELAQQRQGQELARQRADLLTEMEKLEGQLDQLESRLADVSDRLARISRRVGAGEGDITPGNTSTPLPGTRLGFPAQDTGRFQPDPSAGAEDQLYNTAYLDFTRGKFAVAISGFRRYLASLPNTDNADNAQYWIGECFYSLGKMDSAETEFKQVVVSYPRGNKAPSAEYKLGLVYLAQNRNPEARNQFHQVVKLYPGSNEAKLAQDRLRALEP